MMWQHRKATVPKGTDKALWAENKKGVSPYQASAFLDVTSFSLQKSFSKKSLHFLHRYPRLPAFAEDFGWRIGCRMASVFAAQYGNLPCILAHVPCAQWNGNGRTMGHKDTTTDQRPWILHQETLDGISTVVNRYERCSIVWQTISGLKAGGN